MDRLSVLLLMVIIALIAVITKDRRDNMTNTDDYVAPFDKLYVRKSPLGGNGVYAARDIKKGEVLEFSPYIEDELDNFTGVVRDYIFNKSPNRAIVAFGYSSMYNHADVPSADWNIEKNGMKITANKNINKDDEIFISYGSSYWNTRNLEKKLPE